LSDLSEALKEAYARSDSNTRQLVAIEMLHAEFPGGAIRLVNYDSDITVDSETYVGVAMDVAEPESGTDPGDKVALRIDGVDTDMQYWINRAISTATNISVSMRPFAFNLSNDTVIGIVGTYNYLLLKAQYNDQVCVVDLGNISPTNQPFPSVRYTAYNSPELFR